MPKWAKAILRILGVVNCAALLLGISFLQYPAYRVLIKHAAEPQDAPNFRPVFATMTLVELAFIALLLLTAVQFIRAKSSSANLYSIVVLVFIVFEVGTGMLGRAGGIGTSIAVASGSVGTGTAPFEFLFLVPFLYPIFTMILVQLLKQRYSSV